MARLDPATLVRRVRDASSWDWLRRSWAPTAFVMSMLLIMPLRDLMLFLRVGALGPVPAHLAIQAVVLGLAILCALLGCRGPRWSRPEAVFLLAGLATWLVATVLSVLRGEFEAWSYALVGIFLALTLLLRPTGIDVPKAAVWSCFALLGLFVLSVPLASIVGRPTLIYMPDLMATFAQGMDRPGRWQSFYLYVMSMAMTGTFMIIIGSLTRGIRRSILVVGGLAFILLALQRSAILATLVAVLPLIWYSGFVQRSRARQVGLGIAVALGAVGLTLAALWRDPDLNGRVPVWRSIAAAVPDHWAFGLGSTGLNQLPAAEVLDGKVHAHDLFLDALARSGVLALCLLIVMIAAAFWASVEAARRGVPQSMALVVLVVGYGLADLGLDPRFWNDSWVIVIMAVLISAWSRQARDAGLSEADARQALQAQ